MRISIQPPRLGALVPGPCSRVNNRKVSPRGVWIWGSDIVVKIAFFLICCGGYHFMASPCSWGPLGSDCSGPAYRTVMLPHKSTTLVHTNVVPVHRNGAPAERTDLLAHRGAAPANWNALPDHTTALKGLASPHSWIYLRLAPPYSRFYPG